MLLSRLGSNPYRRRQQIPIVGVVPQTLGGGLNPAIGAGSGGGGFYTGMMM